KTSLKEWDTGRKKLKAEMHALSADAADNTGISTKVDNLLAELSKVEKEKIPDLRGRFEAAKQHLQNMTG
ncbi:unnamed protein product, partial [Amoebophrya sp. A25]